MNRNRTRARLGRPALAGALILCALTAAAQTQEFRGTLSAPAASNRSKEMSFAIDVRYEIQSDGSLLGSYTSWQSGPCRGERALRGSIAGERLKFSVDAHETQGCGRPNFEGERRGDDWVGQIFFNGAKRDITLNKR